MHTGAAWRLFGPGGGALPNGTYTLTATPYTEAGGRGNALTPTTVTFTVTGSFEAGTAFVTGFTLVDARDGLPDPDLGALADGATVNLSRTGGLASVRAEMPRRSPVAAVRLALNGPRTVDRIAPARAPVSLFGDSGGDYVAGAFPDGAYTLTARPLDSLRTDGFDDGAAWWTPYGGAWQVSGGVYEVSGGREGKALLDGFAAADLVLETDVRAAPGGNAGVVFRASDVRESRNAFRGYYAGVDVDGSKAVVGRMDDGVWHRLAKLDMDAAGPWYRLRVVATGPRIEVFVDGAPVLDIEDATYASGAVGLRTWEFAAEWDDVEAVRLDDPDGLLPETAVAFTVQSVVPEVAIVADGPATEGGTATFTISAEPAPPAELEVVVSVTQGTADDYLPATLPTSVRIAAGSTEATLKVALPDDAVDEPDGVLTAS
ncbi:MAG: DUF1080 domain-containing protein, partial [Gammaproteobacteria bacterium]|nr:DUF1080 domain-containing protein [Gammaproteobacteria bacterium]